MKNFGIFFVGLEDPKSRAVGKFLSSIGRAQVCSVGQRVRESESQAGGEGTGWLKGVVVMGTGGTKAGWLAICDKDVTSQDVSAQSWG